VGVFFVSQRTDALTEDAFTVGRGNGFTTCELQRPPRQAGHVEPDRYIPTFYHQSALR